MPRRPKPVVKLHTAELLKLIRRGYTQSMVAERWNVDQSIVSREWTATLQRMNSESKRDYTELILERLEQYGLVKQEAWEQWDLSKAAVDSLLEGEGPPPKADDTWLKIIIQCIDSECDLQGLQAPKRKMVDLDVGSPEDAEELLESMLPIVKRALEMVGQKKTTTEAATAALSEAAKLGLTLPVIPLDSQSQPNSEPNTVIVPPTDDEDFDLEAWLAQREKDNSQ